MPEPAIPIVPDVNVPPGEIHLAPYIPQYVDNNNAGLIWVGNGAMATGCNSLAIGANTDVTFGVYEPPPESWIVKAFKEKYPDFQDNRTMSSIYWTYSVPSGRHFPEIDTVQSFPEFVKVLFGFDSKAIVRLVGEQIVKEVVLLTYANSLPGTATYAQVNDGSWYSFTYDNTVTSSTTMNISTTPYLEPERAHKFDLFLMLKGQLARELLCLDRLQTLIKSHSTPWYSFNGTVAKTDQVRQLLKDYDEPRRLRILSTVTDIYTLNDTANQYDDIKGLVRLPMYFKDVVDLHDQIAKLHRVEMAKKNNRQIAYVKNLSLLDKLTIPVIKGEEQFELKLVVPPDSMTMNCWGFELHNCLGMYGDRYAQEGTSQEFVLGFERDSKIVYAARYACVTAQTQKGNPLAGFRCIEFRMDHNANDPDVANQANAAIAKAWEALARVAETV